MKKIISFILASVLLLSMTVGMTACGNKDNGAAKGDKKEKVTLNVYNWGDYIDRTVLDDFEEEYGIKVNYEVYPDNEAMYLKLKDGGNNYDVAIPSDYMITKLINEDMLEQIDLNNISNFKHIDDKFKNLAFDPENKYSVPYMWGTVGIMYNTKYVKEEVDSWNIFWNEKYKDQILMIDSQRDAIAVALDKLGYSINSTDIKELEEAKAELIKQKPLVLSYVGDEGKDRLVEEDGVLSVVWSGDAVTMMERNSDLRYVVPKEGSNLWFDNMVIPAGCEHKKEAELFIDFMTRPEISLKNTEYIGYSTPNKETFKMLPEEVRNNKVAYPDDKVINNAEVFVDLGEFIKEYNDAWTDILAQ